jgi:hypothetical protein
LGHATGLGAALLAASSYVLIHQPLHLLTEVVFTPIVLLVTLALWDAVQNRSARQFLKVGAWIGISALVRPTLLFLPLFLFFPLVLRLRMRQGLYGGGAVTLATLMVVGPWLIRNRIQHQAWFPLATSNALLWLGSPEYYRLLREQGYKYEEVWREVIYGPGWREHDPTSVAGDRWWTARALRSIYKDPFTYVLYAAEKLGTYWVGDPNADWNDERIFSMGALRRAGFDPDAAVAVMVARALPLLALVSILTLWVQRRRLLPIYAILLYCTLLHAATHAEARLSEPLQPLLLVLLSGAAIHHARAWLRRWPISDPKLRVPLTIETA